MSVRIQEDWRGRKEVVVAGDTIASYEWMEDGDSDRSGVALWGDDVLEAIRSAHEANEPMMAPCKREGCRDHGEPLVEHPKYYRPSGTVAKHTHVRGTRMFEIEAAEGEPWSLGLMVIIDDDGHDLDNTVQKIGKYGRIVQRLNKQEGRTT